MPITTLSVRVAIVLYQGDNGGWTANVQREDGDVDKIDGCAAKLNERSSYAKIQAEAVATAGTMLVDVTHMSADIRVVKLSRDQAAAIWELSPREYVNLVFHHA